MEDNRRYHYKDYKHLNLNFTLRGYQVKTKEGKLKNRVIALCHEIPDFKVKALTIDDFKRKVRDEVIKRVGNTQIFRSCLYSKNDKVRFNARIKC